MTDENKKDDQTAAREASLSAPAGSMPIADEDTDFYAMSNETLRDLGEKLGLKPPPIDQFDDLVRASLIHALGSDRNMRVIGSAVEDLCNTLSSRQKSRKTETS